MTAQQNKQPKKADETTEAVEQRITCGIIMPIATMSPEYTAEHWEDVRAIIDAAIERAGFEPRIVSDSEDSTIIHKSIINNIYNDEIIVCDVSNKNANVMFELGMRLAFNKPVVIIKDDKTGYSFDTSNIEHVGYRKDLRHNTVEKFISDLSRKIKATYEAPKKDGYQPFLSHFGEFEVAKIDKRSIEGGEALEKLLNKMTFLENKINTLIKPNNTLFLNDEPNHFIKYKYKYKIKNNIDLNYLDEIVEKIKNSVSETEDVKLTNNGSEFFIEFSTTNKSTYYENIANLITPIIDQNSTK